MEHDVATNRNIRPDPNNQCEKGGKHKMKNEGGENFCEKCGLVFENDISGSKDKSKLTIKSGDAEIEDYF